MRTSLPPKYLPKKVADRKKVSLSVSWERLAQKYSKRTMKKVYEVKLAKHRYNYFTGWCVSYSGIVLFVDNMLDTENNTDDLTIDFVYPK